MTIELFRNDSYLKSCNSKIIKIEDDGIILDQTIFYPEAGGQPGDKGKIIIGNEQIDVLDTRYVNNEIMHVLENISNLSVDYEIECKIDWERRFNIMQVHTTLHLLCSLISAPVTGGQINENKGRLDFDLETKPNKEEILEGLNNLIKQNYEVSISSISAPVLGFFKTRPELASPDIQVHFIPYRVVLENGKRTLGKDPGITCTVNQNRPESRGNIHIKSNNPEEHPKINCNFLDNPLDRETLVDGVKLIRKIMGSEEVQNYCGEELQPGDNFSSDKDILQFIRDKAETLYHPSGTCKMGQDKFSVVDEKLKVKGLENLRVADASIMPTLISGNTNGPCMMIGERCAEFIINDN